MNPKNKSFSIPKGNYSQEYWKQISHLAWQNFCTKYCLCSKRQKVYYLRSLHRETQPLASAKARSAGKLQLRIPQEKMAPSANSSPNCKKYIIKIYN
jgi:hypothetical protein